MKRVGANWQSWVAPILLQMTCYQNGSFRVYPTPCRMTGFRARCRRTVQILLGHAKIESTVRYLGVDVEDALALSEKTEI